MKHTRGGPASAGDRPHARHLVAETAAPEGPRPGPRVGRLAVPWPRNELFRGSVNLVANNVTATGLGFLGWVVTTRLFSVGDVGTAAAAIATASLLANLAFLGAPGTILRFLPTSQDRSSLVKTALSVTLVTATVIAALTAAVQVRSAPSPREALLAATVFVVFAVTLVAKAVTESAAIASRASQVALSATLAGNVAKVAALLVLGWLAAGPLGILSAQAAAALVSLGVLAAHLRASGMLRGGSRLDRDILRRTGGYASSSYVNALVGGLPLLLLPVLVKASLGAESAGYWYVASLLATAMTLVSSAVGQSLLVEASHARGNLRHLAWRSLRWLTTVSVPMAAVAVLVAPWILVIFGRGYAVESLAAFRVLAVSTLFSPVVYVLGTVFFVRRRIAPLVVANLANGVVVLVLASRADSVEGVAWAWLLGEVVYVVLFLAFLPLFRERPASGGAEAP